MSKGRLKPTICAPTSRPEPYRISSTNSPRVSNRTRPPSDFASSSSLPSASTCRSASVKTTRFWLIKETKLEQSPLVAELIGSEPQPLVRRGSSFAIEDKDPVARRNPRRRLFLTRRTLAGFFLPLALLGFRRRPGDVRSQRDDQVVDRVPDYLRQGLDRPRSSDYPWSDSRTPRFAAWATSCAIRFSQPSSPSGICTAFRSRSPRLAASSMRSATIP